MRSRAQIAIEFVVLLMMSALIILALLVSLSSVASKKQAQQAYFELQDLGQAVQQELVLAAQLNDGYKRTFYMPVVVRTHNYTLDTGNATSGSSYFTIDFQGVQLFYKIPLVAGELQPGFNNITKEEGKVYLNT